MHHRTPLLLSTMLGLACLSALPTLAGAADNAAADQKCKAALESIKNDPSTAPDKLFVFEAAGGNLYEVAFGKLVESKVQDPNVKAFAQMMSQDHQAANDALMPIAQKMGLDLPTDLPSDQQAKLDIFATLPPDQLETAYIMDMKADHFKDVTSYMDHESAVKDADLRGYVSQTLPKLKQHLQHALRIATAKGMGGTPMGNSVPMGGMDHTGANRTPDHDVTGPQPANGAPTH